MWKTEYTDEAKNFFVDNSDLVEDLFRSIESLRATAGLPGIGAIEIEPTFFYWLTDSHIVGYQRVESRKVCRIISIRPDDY
ncbi:MAG TPA: hypothetical protein P5121_05195 [Caldilineaceae bacterium]|nr:hypothetical protein [Caldilineaceae bacterium]